MERTTFQSGLLNDVFWHIGPERENISKVLFVFRNFALVDILATFVSKQLFERTRILHALFNLSSYNFCGPTAFYRIIQGHVIDV